MAPSGAASDSAFPTWTSRIEPIRRFRRARIAKDALADDVQAAPGEIEDRLVAIERSAGRSRFRAVRALVQFRDASLKMTKQAREALGVKAGDRVATIPFE